MSRFQAQLSQVDADRSGSYCVSVCGYNDCWDDSRSVACVTCSICASSALHGSSACSISTQCSHLFWLCVSVIAVRIMEEMRVIENVKWSRVWIKGWFEVWSALQQLQWWQCSLPVVGSRLQEIAIWSKIILQSGSTGCLHTQTSHPSVRHLVQLFIQKEIKQPLFLMVWK